MRLDKRVDWNDEKNTTLITERGISFEDVCAAIQNGYLRGIVKGKEPKYAHQRLFVVFINGYTYAVPFVEDENKIFLKTIYPSRELHKKYSNGGHDA